MRNLFGHHFTLKPGVRVYVPTDHGRGLGEAIKAKIEDLWAPPPNFYHLKEGGHVAAARRHCDATWVASIDLARFFDQITRTRVLRALMSLRIKYAEAWEMACDSVVDKSPPQRRFSLPFGFVQSPIIASLVLARSQLGAAIHKCEANGVKTSVYVDDITLSADEEGPLRVAIDCLESAASQSRFPLNAAKFQPPGPRAVSFNIEFGSGHFRIIPDRMVEFEVAVRNGSEFQVDGVLGYVGSVNGDQADELAGLIP